MARFRKGALLCAIVFILSLPCPATKATGGDAFFGSQGLRLGYSSRLLFEVSLSDAQAALTLWARELNRLAGYSTPTQATIYGDLPTLMSAIENREVDFVDLSTLEALVREYERNKVLVKDIR